MKHILISWIGAKDMAICEQLKTTDNESGPLMATIKAITFDQAYFLYNYNKKEVNPFLSWIGEESSLKFNSQHVKLSSPIDFGEIYRAVDTIIKKICDENPGAKYSILLSPGTPAMQAVSILLGKTKYPVNFIQSSIEKGVQEITLPFNITAEFIPERKKLNDQQLRELNIGQAPCTAAFDDIITQNSQMFRLKEKAAILAQRNVPVLIYGESGTGKELFAHAIHNSSPRADKPMIALNCGAIAPDLIDSILFGHKKGAFTNAVKDSQGYFEAANGGTLFLDEFAELPKAVQVRLLRVLQEGKIIRVGETKERTVDVRIIAATNKNINKEIAEGRFREDLFYRVAVGVVNLPPLREREGDLIILANYLLERINSEAGSQDGYRDKKISVKGKNLILNHAWPGNVRELYATLLRASLWSVTDKISEIDIQEAMFDEYRTEQDVLSRCFNKDFNINDVMDEVRVSYVKKALKESNGSKLKASELLGLSNYQTLTNWLEKYNIELI